MFNQSITDKDKQTLNMLNVNNMRLSETINNYNKSIDNIYNALNIHNQFIKKHEAILQAGIKKNEAIINKQEQQNKRIEELKNKLNGIQEKLINEIKEREQLAEQLNIFITNFLKLYSKQEEAAKSYTNEDIEHFQPPKEIIENINMVLKQQQKEKVEEEPQAPATEEKETNEEEQTPITEEKETIEEEQQKEAVEEEPQAPATEEDIYDLIEKPKTQTKRQRGRPKKG